MRRIALLGPPAVVGGLTLFFLLFVAASAASLSAAPSVSSARGKRAPARAVTKSIVQLSMTHGAGCVLMSGGEVRCWGNFRAGAGSAKSPPGTIGQSPDMPIAVPELAGAEHLGTGFQLVCGLTHGVLKCMGDNQGGRRGLGAGEPELAAREIPAFRGVSRFDANSLHTCAVTTAGSVWCWGYNAGAEVGDGTTTSRARPSRVALAGHAIDVAVGDEFSCAVVRGGDVHCWGLGDAGQLGSKATGSCEIPEDGPLPCAKAPVKVDGVTDAISITAGERHACALRKDGGVRCWGDNSSWQLGGERTGAAVDPGVVGAIQVRAGHGHTCALLADGRVTCWGWNKDGQLGDGTTTTRKQPTIVPGLSDVVEIGPSYLSTCARTRASELYCWGDNRWGQLGLAGSAHRMSPTVVPLSVPPTPTP